MESRTIATNKRAYFDYFISDKLEVGIVLAGCKVKSLRQNGVNLSDAYARILNDELWLVGCHITPYSHGNRQNPDPLRNRKLLLHRKELDKTLGKAEQKGFSILPLSMYFNDKNKVKLQIGLGKSKKQYDKRAAIKEQSLKREISQALKVRQR